MKKRILTLFAMLIATSTIVAAQELDPKFGANPADREANVKMYGMMDDSYKMKAFDEALSFIRQLVEKCPKASVNLYIRGTEIYRMKLNKSQNKAERMKYLDSMMIFFDQRIAAFGDSPNPKQNAAYIKQQKAKLFFDYAPAETEKATTYFRDAIQAAGKDVEPDVVVAFFNMLTEGFKIDMVTLESYMEDYQKLTDLLNVAPSDDTEKALNAVEGLFVTSGAANCENIEKLFKPKYAATPDDTELIKKILALFDRAKCSGDFQFELLEKYYKIDPKPIYAAMLATAYESKRNYTKALEYVQIAIDNESDSKQKAGHMLRASLAYMAMSNYSKAAQMAREVIAIDNTNGMAYLLLANSMASGVGQACTEERQPAYWLVVDAYRNALKHFENDPEQTKMINGQIAACTSNFPKMEDLHMIGLTIGSAYNVSCGWISGTTTVRQRP